MLPADAGGLDSFLGSGQTSHGAVFVQRNRPRKRHFVVEFISIDFFQQ